MTRIHGDRLADFLRISIFAETASYLARQGEMRRVSGALALACALAACERVETDEPPASEPHTYAFTLEGERVVLAGEVPDAPTRKPTCATVRFVARDARGHGMSGEIGDPRMANVEVLGAEGFKRLSYRNESGVFSLTLPARPETLDLFEGDRRIGSLASTLSTRVLPQNVAWDGGSQNYATKLIDHGECGSNVNLLFMPEGYRAEEMGLFRERVKSVMAGLVRVAAFREHANRFDAWISEIPSEESGLSDVNAVRQTAWGIRYGVEERRAIFWGSQAPPGRTILQWSRAKTQSSADVTIILVNSTERLGSTDRNRRVVFLAADASAGRGLAHELGHGLLGLADEYDYGVCRSEQAGQSPNTTRNSDAPPWSSIVTTAPLEGAEYCRTGVWKPTGVCLMHHQAEDFCPVCAGQFRDALAARGPACGQLDCSSGLSPCAPGRVCSFNGAGFCCRKPFPVETQCTPGPDACGSEKVCAVADLASSRLGCVKIGEGCE
jgi:hypothetical protein